MNEKDKLFKTIRYLLVIAFVLFLLSYLLGFAFYFISLN